MNQTNTIPVLPLKTEGTNLSQKSNTAKSASKVVEEKQ